MTYLVSVRVDEDLPQTGVFADFLLRLFYRGSKRRGDGDPILTEVDGRLHQVGPLDVWVAEPFLCLPVPEQLARYSGGTRTIFATPAF